jgi:hypothetical protein
MSAEQIKAISRRLPSELAKGNIAVLDEVVDPKAVDHSLPPGMPPTVESTKKFFAGFKEAFPDLVYKLEQEVAEGDYRAEGRRNGDDDRKLPRHAAIGKESNLG